MRGPQPSAREQRLTLAVIVFCLLFAPVAGQVLR